MPVPEDTERQVSKNAPRPATTRQTSGAGFTFEDFTAASLLAKILAGQALGGIGLTGHTIQWQTAALGWEIDDLLLTGGSSVAPCHLALSCKSNAQVSAAGLPPDFVERAWKQWHAPNSPLRRDSDVLGLVTRRRFTNDFDPQWNDVVEWCSGEDPKLSIARIRQTRKHARIFNSIKAPGGTVLATDEETVELVRHLQVISLDFQLSPSSCSEEAVGICRSLLRTSDRRDAEKLWDDLVRVAASKRVGPGTLTLDTLWSRLRVSHFLKEHPNFTASWNALNALSKDYQGLIKAALPNGATIERSDDKAMVAAAIRNHPIVVVVGASGCGKSALVKSTLDSEFANDRQVWLGPEEAEVATSELQRSRLQIAQPLNEVFQSSASPFNILVIDAAERLSGDVLSRIGKLLGHLVPAAVSASELPWRVVIVSQPEGWRDRLQPMTGRAVHLLNIEPLRTEQVKAVLRTVEDLRWLATRDDAVSALTNLKTLGWVIQASSQFQTGSPELPSLAAIADRIWKFWTEGKASYHGLLVRLAEREAEFARSFALSELETTDQELLDHKPTHLPIRETGRNRIGFEHDLAADWARFQRLTEIEDDVGRWASLAGKPLWGSALRLFGQFLLRQTSDAGNGWDRALALVEAKGEQLASDVLLDALCLDPQARKFLEERADLLFANNGQLLSRLLRRFAHIATVPSASKELLDLDRSLSLYVEAKFRTPIYGLWPPVAGFLRAHLDRVADLVSPTVAEVCELWLVTTPLQIAGSPTLGRREFAEVALATARALQVEQTKGPAFRSDDERSIYSAALNAVRDLPEDVAVWALETVQRRRPSEATTKRIAGAKAAAELERAERRRLDPQHSTRSEELAQGRSHFPSLIPSPRKLPPWPLGPHGRVERHFRHVVLQSTALRAMMEVRPEVAAEILLAALVEECPTAEFSEFVRFEKVGLQHDDGHSYPTAFWKSQFLHFLQVAPDVAMTALIQLVDFATGRWADEWLRGGEKKPPGVTLSLRPGNEKSYIGNSQIFNWTQGNSNFIGQLHCALNAAERWLTLQIDAGADIASRLGLIMEKSSSLAMIGLLVNIAKYQPDLLEGPLLPLVGSEDLYWIDQGRVQNAQFDFDAFNWARSGEAIFNLAREWANAPYRKRSLLEVVVDLLPRAKGIAASLKVASSGWSKPDHPKSAAEFAVLCARLDAANYRLRRDPETGEETTEFVLPEAVGQQIAAFQQASEPALGRLLLPSECERALQGQGRLSETGAQRLAEVLCQDASGNDNSENAGDHDDIKLVAAATLVTCARDWLQTHPEVASMAKSVLQVRFDRITCATERSARTEPWKVDESLRFVAYGVFSLWREDENLEGEWEGCLLKVLTSGDYRAAAVLGSLAHRHSAELGARWWRLLQLALLWSALSMLEPRFEDNPELVRRWDRWVEWLRVRRISGEAANPISFQPLSIWRRLQRLERARWQRAFAADHTGSYPPPDARQSRGLEFGFLGAFFGGLVADTASSRAEPVEADCDLILALWSYEAAFCSEHLNEQGEHRLPDRFAYDLVAKMAFYTARVPADRARELWRGVLELGPAARILIEHFVRSWFIQTQHGVDTPLFAQRWSDMVQFALNEEWKTGGHWFHKQRILQNLLGFGSEVFLANLPDAARIVAGMRDFYSRWAAANLRRDEENISAFAHFLASKPGAGLRSDGLGWLAVAIADPARERYRRERGGAGDALVGLVDTLLREDSMTLRRDQGARDALMTLAAYLAAKQLPEALALQERIKSFR
jgi:ABC-type oligopeptide transport system ATPase subunit